MNQPHVPPPPRGPRCPAPVALEAFSAGEVDETVARHVPECADCRGYVAALQDASAAYVQARPPELLLRKLDRREAEAPKKTPWWRWLFVAGPVAAAAVVAIAVLPSDDVRFKGSSFRVAVLAAGTTEPMLVGPDHRVKAGDSLRFGWESETAGHLLVLERDGTGAATVFWPFEATTSAPVPAGHRAFLEGSVELDDAPGSEWIVAVFSPKPIRAEPLLERLRANQSSEPQVDCDGCKVERIRLLKDR